jgi:hypothetical protein
VDYDVMLRCHHNGWVCSGNSCRYSFYRYTFCEIHQSRLNWFTVLTSLSYYGAAVVASQISQIISSIHHPSSCAAAAVVYAVTLSMKTTLLFAVPYVVSTAVVMKQLIVWAVLARLVSAA